MRKIALILIAVAFVASAALAYPQSSTEEEVRAAILESNAFTAVNLTTNPEDYSSHGALEFWSSGGMMQKITDAGRESAFDVFNVEPKHIQVITLVEGQAAVALYYSEGSMKPKGSELVSHYLTRVTQVFVKEDGKWRVRSSHWSPMVGGSGTSQTTTEQ